MSANEEHIEELLSGFLDGELTAEELREFESAMSADGTLAVKLEQLRQLGSDLRSVPKRSLGSDFAARVLAAARQESPVDTEIVGTEILGTASELQYVCSLPKTSKGERQGNWWRAVGALAALGASVMFAIYVSNWFPSGGLDSGASHVVTVPQGSTAPIAGDSNLAIAGDSNLGETILESENQSDSTLVRKTPLTRVFAVLPIFEIETTLNAWDTNLVGTILSNEGIVWTNPVTASDAVIKVLNETRSINQGLPSSNGDQVALVMVQASSRAIDKAMLKMFESKNDFPHVMMDMAFDMPGKELFEKVTGKSAFATPIAAKPASGGNLENTSQFSRPSSVRPTRPLSRFDSAFMSESENEIANVLLVIRKLAN